MFLVCARVCISDTYVWSNGSHLQCPVGGSGADAEVAAICYGKNGTACVRGGKYTSGAKLRQSENGGR